MREGTDDLHEDKATRRMILRNSRVMLQGISPEPPDIGGTRQHKVMQQSTSLIPLVEGSQMSRRLAFGGNNSCYHGCQTRCDFDPDLQRATSPHAWQDLHNLMACLNMAAYCTSVILYSNTACLRSSSLSPCPVLAISSTVRAITNARALTSKSIPEENLSPSSVRIGYFSSPAAS